MSKQSNGCENNNTQAESRVDTKTTDTGCATEFTRLTQPQLLSSEHELAVGTRSAQASHTEKISSLQLTLSSHNTRPNFRTDRMDRAAVQTILTDLMPANHTIHNKVPRSPELQYLLTESGLILH